MPSSATGMEKWLARAERARERGNWREMAACYARVHEHATSEHDRANTLTKLGVALCVAGDDPERAHHCLYNAEQIFMTLRRPGDAQAVRKAIDSIDWCTLLDQRQSPVEEPSLFILAEALGRIDHPVTQIVGALAAMSRQLSRRMRVAKRAFIHNVAVSLEPFANRGNPSLALRCKVGARNFMWRSFSLGARFQLRGGNLTLNAMSDAWADADGKLFVEICWVPGTRQAEEEVTLSLPASLIHDVLPKAITDIQALVGLVDPDGVVRGTRTVPFIFDWKALMNGRDNNR